MIEKRERGDKLRPFRTLNWGHGLGRKIEEAGRTRTCEAADLGTRLSTEYRVLRYVPVYTGSCLTGYLHSNSAKIHYQLRQYNAVAKMLKFQNSKVACIC